ncbi:MAG: glycosyl transferase family 2 [Cereibacter sphaeroides]|uniref:Glycosyl transferase family 2 n=1 Tax=Cereibacter sphaeroides TaxID=1063 RepID=A0A2W5SDH9_CERSP|nr:MAG: glycosyl transferase family 2 [Cereibacter sphaeroides]
MRALAIITLRNEGSFLLEWLAHHRAVGFTDVLAFSNDCQDGTDLMLDRLAEMGWLTHIRNDRHGARGPQWSALRIANDHPLRHKADWILPFDIDEFVNIHLGDGTLAALLYALPEATAIPLTWRFFGNTGVIGITGAPVTETFTRAAPASLSWPWRASLFKTLFRNDGTYAALGVHRPRLPDAARLKQARWFDGSGRPLPDAFRQNRIFSPPGQDNTRLAQLNHYALGSMQDYLLKCDRGRANREGTPYDAGYWIDRNFCDQEDRSILRMKPRLAPLLAELESDSTLAALRCNALRWRHNRVAQLLREESWRSLYGRLLMMQPSRVLTPEQARTIWEHDDSPDGSA